MGGVIRMSRSLVGPKGLQGAAFLLVGLCFMASPLRALPVVHAVAGGSVDIEVRLGGTTIGSAPGVALLGDTVTIDAAALTLDSVRLEIAPVTIALSQLFGGYDEITVESCKFLCWKHAANSIVCVIGNNHRNTQLTQSNRQQTKRTLYHRSAGHIPFISPRSYICNFLSCRKLTKTIKTKEKRMSISLWRLFNPYHRVLRSSCTLDCRGGPPHGDQ